MVLPSALHYAWLLSFFTAATLIGGDVEASDYSSLWELAEAEHISLEYRDYDAMPFLGIRDSFIAPRDDEMTFGFAINGNFTMLHHKPSGIKWKWNNVWWFDSAGPLVKHVGWRFEQAIQLHKKLDIFYEHESRHVLDEMRDERFPVYDRIGVRIVFIDKGRN